MSERPTNGAGELRQFLEGEIRLNRALRATVLEERRKTQRKDQHPNPEDLLAYQEDWLPAEQQEEIAEHLSVCPECVRIVLDLAAFDEVEPPSRATAPTEAPESSVPFRPPETAPTVSRPGLPAWSGWAATLAVVLAGLAAIWFFPRNGELPGQVGWVYLSPDSAARSGLEVGLDLAPGVQYLTLVLGGAWTEDFQLYRVEILSEAGIMTWATEEAQRAPDGTVAVLVPVAQLPAGVFEVRLSGRTDKGWAPVEKYFGRWTGGRPES